MPMPPLDELLLRLLLVVIVGGSIGAEREYRNKSAGFRTMILICLGSFLFTTFSIAIGGDSSDRIASNIVTGIGFIGGGVIFRSGLGINGLTTAASIWIVAALGMGIADGYYTLVLVSTAIVLISLFLFLNVERLMDKINQAHRYKIVSKYRETLLHDYEKTFREFGLRHKRLKHVKNGNTLTGVWMLSGTKKAHKRFIEHMLQETAIDSFEF
jgi:putative Mg2+ transporter-C (MgtC) family protein